MNTFEGNTIDMNNNNINHHHHHPKPTSTSLYQRYEFPVLAEDPISFSKARSDPLACNVNNDAVLIWNDVIFRPSDALPETSISGASIEDVFQELQYTVDVHMSARRADNEYAKNSTSVYHNWKNKNVDYNYRNKVVERRRKYEQGSDFVFGANSELDHCSGDYETKTKTYHDKEFTSLCLQGNQTSEGLGTPGMTHCPNDIEGVNCLEGPVVNLEEVQVERSNKQEYVSNYQSNNFSEFENYQGFYLGENGYYNVISREGIFMPQNNSSVMASENNCNNNNMDKSRFDSGHFEDMSLDISHVIDNSNHSSACLEHQNQINYDVRRFVNHGEDDDSGEYCVLRFDQSGDEKHDNGTTTDFEIEEEYSEVFIEEGKTNDLSNIDAMDHVCQRNYKQSENPVRALRRRVRDTSRRDDSNVKVRCENQSCGKVSNLVDARKSYKNCHHCHKTYYCSRECRRQDWTRHKEVGDCYGSRVSSACKKVIRHCNSDPEVKAVLSRLAVRGYISHGRGCVMMGFPDLECTQDFLEFGFPMLELNPIYVSAKELSQSKMYGNILENLLGMCRDYKPDVKFVLNVGVGLRYNRGDFFHSSFHRHNGQYCCHNHSHEHTDRSGSLGSDLGYHSLSNSVNNISGETIISPCLRNSCSNYSPSSHRTNSQRSSSSKHRGPILQKFIKLRLTPVHFQENHDKRWVFEEHFWDKFRTAGPTLILTSVPECSSTENESKKRELTFTNIQRKLRQRNVNLCHQYPSVHANLIDYVSRGVHFPSQILFPQDTKTGRTFTCFLMPEAEAEPEWMQSHYLLNDLRLSRDSLNKSMSRSLSSSMPSLVSPQTSPQHLSRSNVSIASNPEKKSESCNIVQSKPRSNSLSKLESSSQRTNHDREEHEAVPLEFYLTSAKRIEPGNESLLSHNVPISSKSYCYHQDERHRNNYVILDINNDSSKSKIPLPEYSNHLLPPLHIEVDQTPVQKSRNRKPVMYDANDNKDNADESFYRNKINIKEVGVLDTTDTAVPKFYPVRKAKNVKLYSNQHHSPRQHLPQRCQTSPVASSQLILPPETPVLISVSTTPSCNFMPATSPALYTSTPLTKTCNPSETFEGLNLVSEPVSSHLSRHFVPSKSFELSPITDPLNFAPPSRDYYYGKVSTPIRSNAEVKGHHTHSGTVEDSKMNRCNGCDGKLMEYGFDSCYRNEVVVDEVDRMKRRRKDRRSRPRLPTPPDMEYCLFENTDLDSPPLATSTLLRSDADQFGRFERNEFSKNSRLRKKQRRCRSHDNDIDKHDNYYHIDSKIITNARERPDVRDIIQSDIAPSHHTNSKRNRPYDESGANQNTNDFAIIIGSNDQFPPDFRRKFNTNSQFFPKDSKLSLPSPSCQKHAGHKFENGPSQFTPDHTQCKNISEHFVTTSKSNSCSHTTINNNNNTHSVDISTPSSQQPTSDTQITAPPLQPSCLNSSRSHHNDPDVNRRYHLRMRLFNDVTHHSANRTTEHHRSASRSRNNELNSSKTARNPSTKDYHSPIKKNNTHPGYNKRNSRENLSSASNHNKHKDAINRNDPSHPSHRQSHGIKISYSSDW